MRNILWLDALGQCRAENEYFAHDDKMGLGVDVATIRRLLVVLEECGLIWREFDACGQRTIRPLATAVELIEAGWASLARAIRDMKKWPAAIRAMCRCLLQRLGQWRKEPDLARLGVSLQDAEAVSSGRNCAASARVIARPFPYKESEALKTTTVRSTALESKLFPVVVSPAEKPSDREPESAAVAIAVEAGLDLQIARKAVGEKPATVVQAAIRAAKVYAARHEVRSLPALLFTAIRNGWLPPAPPSNHPSDTGERPARYVTAPPQFQESWERRWHERTGQQVQLSPKERLAQVRAMGMAVSTMTSRPEPPARSADTEIGLAQIRTRLAALLTAQSQESGRC